VMKDKKFSIQFLLHYVPQKPLEPTYWRKNVAQYALLRMILKEENASFYILKLYMDVKNKKVFFRILSLTSLNMILKQNLRVLFCVMKKYCVSNKNKEFMSYFCI
jgi:hypothetical protein